MINDGSNTVASVGYVCPDGSIYAGIASGRPFYTMPADVDGGYGIMFAGYTNATSYPSSTYAGGAVEACLNLGGWSLPNRDQLNVMYANRNAINTSAATLPGGSAFASADYWSSVEGNAVNIAWFLNFSNGSWTANNKYNFWRARCVRSY